MTTVGVVGELRAPQRLTLSWSDEDWAVETLLSIELHELPKGRTRLGLVHSGWEQFPADERDALVGAHRDGWLRHLASLADHVGG